MFFLIRALTAHVAFALWIFGLVPANAETSGAIHFGGIPQYRDPHALLAGPPDAERVGNVNAEIRGNLWVIYADGLIDPGATARLRDFLTMNNVPHRSQLILNSDGGSLSEAMRLGKLIRENDLMTEIGTKSNLNAGVNGKPWYETNPGECYSACALAYLGGKYRFISPDSVYGVHRFHSASRDLDADDAQILSGTVVQYIRDMGVDPALFTLMTEAGPSEIIRVPRDVLTKLNAVNNGEGPTVWSIEAPPNVNGMYLKGERETWRGMNKFMLVCASKEPISLMVLYYGEGRGREIVNTFTAHVLFIDNNVIPITNLLYNKPKLRLDNDVVSATYLLSENLLKKIAIATTVGVGMQPSANSRTFMGFIGMPFADGSRKLPGFLRACRQEWKPCRRLGPLTTVSQAC
jgi:hypothetical protein